MPPFGALLEAFGTNNEFFNRLPGAGGAAATGAAGARASFLPALANLLENSQLQQSFRFGGPKYSVGIGPSHQRPHQRQLQQTLQLLQKGRMLDSLFGSPSNDNSRAVSNTTTALPNPYAAPVSPMTPTNLKMGSAYMGRL